MTAVERAEAAVNFANRDFMFVLNFMDLDVSNQRGKASGGPTD
jgi:hypothetical protein